ncbi:hypothetical protein [Nonomuraea sp. NPDC003754]
MNTITRALRSRLFVTGEIVAAEQVAPRMRRLRIAGPAWPGHRDNTSASSSTPR